MPNMKWLCNYFMLIVNDTGIFTHFGRFISAVARKVGVNPSVTGT